MAQVKEELVRLRAQKQVFHGGHYNGPDLEKVMTIAVIERMVTVLSPQRFIISDSDAAGIKRELAWTKAATNDSCVNSYDS